LLHIFQFVNFVDLRIVARDIFSSDTVKRFENFENPSVLTPTETDDHGVHSQTREIVVEARGVNFQSIHVYVGLFSLVSGDAILNVYSTAYFSAVLELQGSDNGHNGSSKFNHDFASFADEDVGSRASRAGSIKAGITF
jgi:hypothetical protein